MISKWFPIILFSILIILAILLILSQIPVANSAETNEWYDQLPSNLLTFDTVEDISVKFLGPGAGQIATFRMKDGSCLEFKGTRENITHVRKCGDEEWANYIYIGEQHEE